MTAEVVGSFEISPERGRVSSVLLRPPTARALLALGHGAGTNARHPFMARLAQALAAADIATLRYNYPYSEAGRGGMDGERVRLATVQAAVAAAASAAPDLPHFAGGHSMSGRMTTLAAARGLLDDVAGIVALAFPLHQAGRPGVERSRHLADVTLPLLFLSGDRDRMAQLDLLRTSTASLPTLACLHVLEGADHGFMVLKRSGRTADDVLAEAANTTAGWVVEHAALHKQTSAC